MHKVREVLRLYHAAGLTFGRLPEALGYRRRRRASTFAASFRG